MQLQLTQSNALQKSAFTIILGFFALILESTSSLTVRTSSRMFLPLAAVPCYLEIKLLITLSDLTARILASSL